jgi:hypothetical protein
MLAQSMGYLSRYVEERHTRLDHTVLDSGIRVFTVGTNYRGSSSCTSPESDF